MRPYLSIIKDAFRAAIANKVLLVMFVLITIVLMLIAPFNITEKLDWKLVYDQHIKETEFSKLWEHLYEGRSGDDDPAVAAVWEKLPDSLKDSIQKFYEHDQTKETDEPDGATGEFGVFSRQKVWIQTIEELNNIIQSDDFYDEKVWSNVEDMDPEATELIENGVDSLDEDRRRRLNRILVGRACAPHIINGAQTALEFRYGFFRPMGTFNITRSAFAKVMNSTMAYVMDKFVLSIGLLIAILVTAPIIPNIFDTGSLALLLSKPINRSFLFVAQFFGGCVFVAILSTYLFIGLWLIFGIRLSIWDSSLLWSIPIYILVFAIYYSVSAFVGIWFRNSVVAIIATIAFWAICFFVGFAHNSFDSRMSVSQVQKIVVTDENPLHVDGFGVAYEWSKEQGKWENALNAGDEKDMFNVFYGMSFFAVPPFPQPVAPVYSSKYQAIIGSTLSIADGGGSGKPSFVVSDLKPGSEPHDLGPFPSNPQKLAILPDGDCVLITSNGKFFLLKENPLEAIKNLNSGESAAPVENPEGQEGTPVPNSNVKNQKKKLGETLFEKLGPDDKEFVRSPGSVDVNRTTGDIAVYRRGQIYLFSRDGGGEYLKKQEIELDLQVGSNMTVWLNYQSDLLRLAIGNGSIMTIDPTTGDVINEQKPVTKSAIVDMASSQDGKTSTIVYRNGDIYVMDREANDTKRLKIKGQGDISSAQFDDANRLWVADKTDRVTVYDSVESISEQEEYYPKWGIITKIYRWGVLPLYRVFPKPSEFYKLVTHLSSTTDTTEADELDLTKTDEPKNPWDPLRSGLIFCVVMLSLGCLVFSRTDY